MHPFRLALILSFTAACSPDGAPTGPFRSQGGDWMTGSHVAGAEDLAATKAETYAQTIDHFAKSATFEQRYWVNSSYAAKDDAKAPVFLLICGEGPCSAQLMNDALQAHAAEFGGHMLALEHRYYGKSFPVPDLTTPNMKYLDVAQALEDLASFIKAMKATRKLTGPWVVLGGSYSGSLAAYFRLVHPELTVGALASSAPVKAKEDFEEYDAHTAKALGPECAAAMRKIVAKVDDAIDNDPAAFAVLKKLFNQPDDASGADLGAYVSYPLGGIAQYGYPLAEDFCKVIMVADPMPGLAAYLKALSEAEPSSGNDPGTAIPPEDTEGGRMWRWQVCTEFGYWPVSHHDRSVSLQSKAVDLAYYRQICKFDFDQTAPVDTAKTNRRYYEPLVAGKASHILYTNGSLDPWSTLSFTGAAKGTEVYTAIIEGGHHCNDLAAPAEGESASLQAARAKFSELLRKWLPR